MRSPHLDEGPLPPNGGSEGGELLLGIVIIVAVILTAAYIFG